MTAGSGTVVWSEVHALKSGDHLQIGRRPGVYRIRAYDLQGSAVAIARVRGMDALGILHIGKSVDLGVRIRTFRQAAEGLKAPHHAGIEFHRWGFGVVFPIERLWFDYAITPDEAEALRLERMLHEEYRREFFDRPPLDGTSGQGE